MTDKKETLFPDMDLDDDEIYEQEDNSLLEKEIVKLIDRALRERLIELAIDDIRLIAKELMPDFDRMIAQQVKTHFYEIGTFLVSKFGDMEGE